jgi:serine/threonine protein phosphatase PrpC
VALVNEVALVTEVALVNEVALVTEVALVNEVALVTEVSEVTEMTDISLSDCDADVESNCDDDDDDDDEFVCVPVSVPVRQMTEPVITTYLKNRPRKGQDFVASGITDHGLHYLVIGDGHGGYKTCNLFRRIDWCKELSLPNFQKIIFEKVKDLGNTYMDGSTLTIVLVDSKNNHIDVYWAGDSTVVIYRDGCEIFRTTDEEEMKKLSTGVIQTPCKHLIAITPDTLFHEKGTYFKFFGDNSYQLNMPRAIGHNGKTGQQFSNQRIPITEGQHKIVVGSDGLWDMICKTETPFIVDPNTTATDLGVLAFTRWHKTDWNLMRDLANPSIIDTGLSTANNVDDVSVAVCSFTA